MQRVRSDMTTMTDQQTEIGLGLKMDGTTHFNDLTNFVTSPRNATSNNLAGAASDQQAHHGITSQGHMNMNPGASYDTSSQDTLVKHSTADLAVFHNSHLAGGSLPSADNASHSQQPEARGETQGGNSDSLAPHSSDLAQAFADMGSHLSTTQRSIQELKDTHDYFCSPVQGPYSHVTMQSHPAPEEVGRSAQLAHNQAQRDPMQVKLEASPSVERHQAKSYPSSPPSRSQMTPQSDLRSFEGGPRPTDGRHVLTHRPSHSLGQAGAFMSGSVPDRSIFAHSHVSAPVSPSEGMSAGQFAALFHYPNSRHEVPLNLPEHVHMLDQGGPHLLARNSNQFSRPCAPSVRSTSPSASMASTSMTSISPMGSGRLNPDGSFTSQETSFDSVSNAASGSFSRASSTSEEVFYSEVGSLGLASSLRMSKQKKKLRNIDRKMICDYSVANPSVKQDAIANEFGIERSTVSKILKQKDKWLAIDPKSDAARIAKHRAVKFPAVEDRLTSWVAQLQARGEAVRDCLIRNEALRIAAELGLGEDKFKASGGWIEKFRERNAIPKPQSVEQNTMTSRAYGSPDSPTPSPDRSAAPHVARPASFMEAVPASSAVAAEEPTGNGAQSRPTRRQPVRSNKGKGTPQKRARDEEKSQAALGVSPLSQDMARMHFLNAISAPMPEAAFSRPCFYEGQAVFPQQSMQNCNLFYSPHGIPGSPQAVADGDQFDRKRRRAAPETQAKEAAVELGPAISFQLPPAGGPEPSSQMNMPIQFPQLTEANTSPQNGSPRGRRTVGKAAGDNSSCGRSRRGKASLSHANHAPQTPSPLSMSPADARVDSSLQTLSAEAEQLTAATLERLRALQNAGDTDSIVTVEQAKQSLELVLRFLREQPSDFLPPDHFVVFGHLQANIEQKIRDHSQSQSQPRDSPVAEGSGSEQASLQLAEALTPTSGEGAPAKTDEP